MFKLLLAVLIINKITSLNPDFNHYISSTIFLFLIGWGLYYVSVILS